MPDTLEPAGGGRCSSDMESRVAVLEQIACSTTAALERLERRFDAADQRMDSVMREQCADFRWQLGLILAQTAALLGVMAHGFHWL